MPQRDELETPKREWVPNPNGPNEVYSNYVDASWTLFDIRVLFGHLKPAALNSEDFSVEEQVAVTMSWAHAKHALSLLSGLLESYEKVNGLIAPLKLAPGIRRDEDQSD